MSEISLTIAVSLRSVFEPPRVFDTEVARNVTRGARTTTMMTKTKRTERYLCAKSEREKSEDSYGEEKGRQREIVAMRAIR